MTDSAVRQQTRISRGQWFSTVQLLFLSSTFLLPYLGTDHLWYFDQTVLGAMLAYEFGVIVFGFLFFSLMFVPLLYITNNIARYVTILALFIIAMPFTMLYRDDYGWSGLVGFLYLVFATYCGVLLQPMQADRRIELLAEIALRWLVYMILFLALGEMVPTIYVENIMDHEEGYLFGASYFGACALLEYSGRFPRTVALGFDLARGRYSPKPRALVRNRNGSLRGYHVQKTNTHMWPFLLFSGVACSGLVLVFFYVSFQFESSIGRIAFWVFLSPFALTGFLLLAGAPVLMVRALRAGYPYLYVRSDDHAEGTVPIYVPGARRKIDRIELRSVKAFPLDQYEDNWQIEETPLQRWVGNELIVRHDDIGSHFSIEHKNLFVSGDSRRLHVSGRDVIEEQETEIPWEIAIPLP